MLLLSHCEYVTAKIHAYKLTCYMLFWCTLSQIPDMFNRVTGDNGVIESGIYFLINLCMAGFLGALSKAEAVSVSFHRSAPACPLLS